MEINGSAEREHEFINGATNGGKDDLISSAPYTVTVTIEGVAPLLFHRWDCDAIETKSKAAKNSAAKKTDNIESYVYRDENGTLCIPGTYLVGSLCDRKNGAAKYVQDPRSPRKSGLDLFKAGVICLTDLASTGKTDWDYLDRRRVVVQQSGITRVRPALNKGWRAEFDLMVATPEYISPTLLLETLNLAGRLCGVGDYRPTYGRFSVVSWKVRK